MLQTANQQTHFHKWRNPNYSILAFCILFDFTSLLHKLHIKCNKQLTEIHKMRSLAKEFYKEDLKVPWILF